MEALLVGGGAVGMVFARHLQLGGARVAFYLRPQHLAAAQRGLVVYPLNRRHPRRNPVVLENVDLLTTPAEVAARHWDCVILCVSSTALRRGDWLAEIARASGDATVVAIQPGPDDPAFVRARAGAARVVWSMFGLISYSAADVGEAVPRPGIAYWRPPLSKLPFSGDAARVRAIVDALNRGGLPSRAHPDVPREVSFVGAVLDLHVQALHCAGWRFAELRRDRELLRLTHSALAEALAIAARHQDARAPWLLKQLRPWHSRLVLGLAPRLTPLDIERYFRVHFTKVADQSAAWLASHIALADTLQLPSESLRRLQALLAERTAPKEASNVHALDRGDAKPDPKNPPRTTPRA
jgi:2-dehydropantoate 2-reductase